MIKKNLKTKPIRKIKKRKFLDKSLEIKLMQYADGTSMKPWEKDVIEKFVLAIPKYKKIVSGMKLSKKLLDKFNKSNYQYLIKEPLPNYLKKTIKKLNKSERKIFFDRITRDKDTGLTDTQKKEIDEMVLGMNMTDAWPIFKKYINSDYLRKHKDLPTEFRDTLKVFSKGKRTKLVEIDKLIKKYGFTRFIQMFSRLYKFNFLLDKDYQPILKTKSSGVKNIIKTYNKIKKKIKN
ncbi:MAG: hypothetical protein H8E55_02500 [Pelagibacterales bacterium]|nr:hypothetical protein [Pelagibacterales bacterium]